MGELVNDKKREPFDEATARALCVDFLGQSPSAFAFPGGAYRDSARAQINKHRIIVTHRKDLKRAQLEALVLRTLNRQRGPVPRLIAQRGAWLIQQDVGTERLSQALQKAAEPARLQLLINAAKALAQNQQFGHDAGLSEKIVTLGASDEWIAGIIEAPRLLSERLDIAAPLLNAPMLQRLLAVELSRFIKWDARPGNAVVRPDGSVIWIDWEHCGTRNPLDDLVWLLCDEYTPFSGDSEKQLLERLSPGFAPNAPSTLDYLSAFGCLHSCQRLGMVLSQQAKRGWGTLEACLASDRVGVVPLLAENLCLRGEAWAGWSESTQPLVTWFGQIRKKLPPPNKKITD